MIHIKHGFLTIGDRVLFDDINATILPDQKIGLVGNNGAGKSTLLKIIVGERSFDEGQCLKDRSMRIGYFSQDLVVPSCATVFDEVVAACEIDDETPEYERERMRQQVMDVLGNLGLTPHVQKAVEALSVGLRMRVILARLLVSQVDFYLFDEPTNHLDLHTKEWFIAFLRSLPVGYILVSHDRYFLDEACTGILALSRGKLVRYQGNFTQYCIAKEQEDARIHQRYVQQQKDIARQRETIERFRAKPSKARMAQSMLKKLEAIELIEPEPLLPTVSFSFPLVVRAGDSVLDVRHVSCSYGTKQVLNDISFQLKRGQKAAIIAPNGTGKTTLLHALVGMLQPTRGTITFGHNVSHAFFQQDQVRALKSDLSILEQMLEACPTTGEQAIRSALGSFLFSNDDVHKKIACLSGGEKNRVALAILLLQKTNFLLLDEPTNHLDMYAKEVLAQALRSYQGTVLFVSHDRYFIQQVANVLIALEPNGAEVYSGDYESYVEHKRLLNKFVQTESAVAEQKKQEKNAQCDEQKSDQVGLRKRMYILEKEIAKLEAKQIAANERLFAQSPETPAYQKYMKDLQEISVMLEKLLAKWQALADQC